MKLACSKCDRVVGAGRYYRTGDTCGAWTVTAEAVFPDQPAVRERCRGVMEPIHVDDDDGTGMSADEKAWLG